MHIKLRNQIIRDARKLSNEADRCEGKTTQQLIKEMQERKYRKLHGKKSFAIISNKKIHGQYVVGKGSSLRIARKHYREAKASNAS